MSTLQKLIDVTDLDWEEGSYGYYQTKLPFQMMLIVQKFDAVIAPGQLHYWEGVLISGSSKTLIRTTEYHDTAIDAAETILKELRDGVRALLTVGRKTDALSTLGF